MLEAAAPGKLLLSGEYAVLRGAPAVSLAVGVSARVRITRRTLPSQIQDARSGRSFPFQWLPASGLKWLQEDPGEPGRLPTAVFHTLAAHWPEAHIDQGLQIELVSDEFSAGQQGKFGLGSSAALTVALVGAMIQVLGESVSQQQLAALACTAHRRFQSGSGSGADVLTSVYGRLLCIDSRGDLPAGEPLSWPDGLHLVVVWSGHSASTPGMIRAFDRLAARPDAAEFLQALEQAAERAADAWRAGEVESILTATRDYAVALQHLDAAGLIGILTDDHRALAAISESCGAVYKTSGAGGGDLGFALCGDQSTAQRLQRQFEAQGYQVLERPLAVAGLSLKGQA